MGMLRKAAQTATLLGMLYADVTGQQTYQQSIRAKQNAPCAWEFQRKTGGAYRISDIARKTVRVTRDAQLDKSLSDQQRISRLMNIRDDIRKELGREYAQYVGCVANYSLISTVSSSLYAKAGRTQPPLTGTYEEQVRTIVREMRWELNYYAGLTAAAERKRAEDASHVIRTVRAIVNIISDLPDPISADIDINSQGFKGTIRPKFMGYGGNDLITLRSNATPPGNSRLESKSDNYELYSVRSPPQDGFVLLERYSSGGAFAYSSFGRGDLLKYMEFLKAGSSGRKISNNSSPWRFEEFSRFLNRLGNNFDGTARFGAGSTRIPYGDSYVIFEYYGLKGHNNVGRKDLGIAVYFDSDPRRNIINPDHIRFMRDNFREFAVGGPRQEMHMFLNMGGHGGTHSPGVIELPVLRPGHMFIIKEER